VGWEETVIRHREIRVIYTPEEKYTLDLSFIDDYRNEVDFLLRAQAEKTWPIAYSKAFKEGKRDIIEWQLSRGIQTIATLELQTILKGLT